MSKGQASHSRKMHTIEQSEEMFIGTVHEQVKNIKSTKSQNENEDNWTETLKIYKRNVKVKLDTGAECNVPSESTYKTLNITGRLQKSSCKLVAYSGHKMEPLGKKAITCEYKGQKYRIVFEIIQNDAPAILGHAACQKLGMVKRLSS